MASQEECLAAILEVVDRFNAHDAGRKRQRLPERSVGCTILDLDVTYRGELQDGFLIGICESEAHEADIRLVCSSDDLVGMVNRTLNFAHLYSTGRVRIDASLRDLIRLRALA